MNVQRQGRVFDPGSFECNGSSPSSNHLPNSTPRSTPRSSHYANQVPSPSPIPHPPQQPATPRSTPRSSHHGFNQLGSTLTGSSPQSAQRSAPTCSTPVPLRRSSSCSRAEPPSEEDPLQNPRPPEAEPGDTCTYNGKCCLNITHHRCDEQNFVYRAKRWSAQISSRASILWGGMEVPPPVPRHRDTSKYNQNTSDANHIRLFERKTRAYTCRELLCIVFLPCLLICLLGIALSSLVIYYQIGKDYEKEIESLELELSVAREKDGVYLTSQKYRELVDLGNSRKLEEENHKSALAEMTTLLESKTLEVEGLTRKITSLRDTLDCTYTVVQTGSSGGPSVQDQLEDKCKLSHRAQLLLAVSDQAVETSPQANSFMEEPGKPSLQTKSKERFTERALKPGRLTEFRLPAHPDTPRHSAGGVDSQHHWLLGSKRGAKTESAEFQQFLVTELSRMEQNILDFSSQHQTFCSEFGSSLDTEVERRGQDLSTLANKLGILIEQQAKAIGKLESLASDQMYAEQKWVTSYLKNTRNEADRQSVSLQGFLTESFLPSIRLMNSGILDMTSQVSSLQSTLVQGHTSASNKLNAFLDSQKKLILSTKDNIINLSKQQNSEIQILVERQDEMRKAEAQFQTRFREAQRKIDSLLTSVMAEYSQYSSVVNSSTSRTLQTLDSLTTRSQRIDSSLNLAVSKIVSDGDTLMFGAAQDKLKMDSDVSSSLENTQAALKTLSSEVAKVEVQGKQMVGERQGAWELHYSNSEILLRKKADTNKELLQKHQVQTQESHSSLLQFSNQLEEMSERKRQVDATHTADRQADLQAACKNVAGFSSLLSGELHARDSDLANYLANKHKK